MQLYVGASGNDKYGVAFSSGWMIQEINRFSVLSLYDNSKMDVSPVRLVQPRVCTAWQFLFVKSLELIWVMHLQRCHSVTCKLAVLPAVLSNTSVHALCATPKCSTGCLVYLCS